jgi:hypothetical protein
MVEAMGFRGELGGAHGYDGTHLYAAFGNSLGHLFYDERITGRRRTILGPCPASFLTQNCADLKADKLHQIRGSDRNQLLQISSAPCRSNRAVDCVHVWIANGRH